MKERISIKDAGNNIYLGYVLADDRQEVTEEDFLKFAERARRLFGYQVKKYSDLLAAKEITIVRKSDHAAFPIIGEPTEYDARRNRYVNTFWKGIKHERHVS